MAWEGRFSSLKLPQGIACGEITVDKVDIYSEGYTSNASIKYTGLFKKGKVVNVSVLAKGNTMKVMLEDRDVTFTIETRSDNIVTGSYIVKGLDKGQFYLQPKGRPPIENPQSCIVM